MDLVLDRQEFLQKKKNFILPISEIKAIHTRELGDNHVTLTMLDDQKLKYLLKSSVETFLDLVEFEGIPVKRIDYYW